ncbi:helix-turn-helix domain-containing protein [Lysinibacillus composti]|nr:helix-turn-helix transcriptional regulator [Lysinibacillus composti]
MLKFFRKKEKMTQEEIADKLNVTQSCVSKLESGRKLIDIQTFMNWVRVTNSEVHAASMMFGMDLTNVAMQVLQTAPMYIGGFGLWI